MKKKQKEKGSRRRLDKVTSKNNNNEKKRMWKGEQRGHQVGVGGSYSSRRLTQLVIKIHLRFPAEA